NRENMCCLRKGLPGQNRGHGGSPRRNLLTWHGYTLQQVWGHSAAVR
ncbi:MAG: hypothetical protein G01um101477_380, partial [Candidatus Doudnabacteria bacterium Gr01-1014_77]